MGQVIRKPPGKPYTVAIVPTKLTSIRVPRKNIADLGGQPLFHFSVRAAKLVDEIDHVFVSSEDDDVLRQSARLGAETIKRPEELCGPEVTNLEVVVHALATIDARYGVRPELVVLLQPTHPFRRPSDIRRGLAEISRDEKADCLFSVIRTDELRGRIEQDRYIPEFPLPRNKHEEPACYRNTGSFYIFRVTRTLDHGRLFGNAIVPLRLDRAEFEIDIDTDSDLALARCLLEALREEVEELGLIDRRSP